MAWWVGKLAIDELFKEGSIPGKRDNTDGNEQAIANTKRLLKGIIKVLRDFAASDSPVCSGHVDVSHELSGISVSNIITSTLSCALECAGGALCHQTEGFQKLCRQIVSLLQDWENWLGLLLFNSQHRGIWANHP